MPFSPVGTATADPMARNVRSAVNFGKYISARYLASDFTIFGDLVASTIEVQV